MDPDAITRHLSEGIGQNYEVNQEARAFNLLASFQLVELALKIYISIAYDVIRLRVHGLVPFKPDETALEKASLERLLGTKTKIQGHPPPQKQPPSSLPKRKN